MLSPFCPHLVGHEVRSLAAVATCVLKCVTATSKVGSGLRTVRPYAVGELRSVAVTEATFPERTASRRGGSFVPNSLRLLAVACIHRHYIVACGRPPLGGRGWLTALATLG